MDGEDGRKYARREDGRGDDREDDCGDGPILMIESDNKNLKR